MSSRPVRVGQGNRKKFWLTSEFATCGEDPLHPNPNPNPNPDFDFDFDFEWDMES